MAQMGFTPEDYEDDEVLEVWPENWRIFTIFTSLGGQWLRGGMNGQPYALNYPSLYPLLDRAFPDPEEWDEAFTDVRVMEIEALKTMSKHSE